MLGLIIVLVIINLIRFKNSSSIPNKPSETTLPAQELKVLRISPEQNTILTPNTYQTFNIQFTSAILQSYFKVLVIRQDVTTDSTPKTEEVITDLTDNNTTLSITLKNPIQGYSSYEINLLSSADNSPIFKIEYLSDKPQETPAPNNNTQLKQFLPYKTNSYELEYNEDTNIYLFHFIYNSDSSETLDSQYQKAKQAATNFIKSKGIDINSIIIEWRYS